MSPFTSLRILTQLHRVTRLAWLVAAIVLMLPAGAVRAQPPTPTLYGITRNNELITINTAPPAGTVAGTLKGKDPSMQGMQVIGLAFVPPGVSPPLVPGALYTYNSTYNYYGTNNSGTDTLWQVDPNTGAVMNPVYFGAGIYGEGDLTFDNNGTGYLAGTTPSPGGNVLYQFTLPPAPGKLGFLGKLSNPIPGFNSTLSMDGLAFDNSPTPKLYGISQSISPGDPPTARLFTIDTSKAALTLVGDTGQGEYQFGGLAFDPSPPGSFYAALAEGGSSGRSFLYKLDTSGKVINGPWDIGFNRVCGLSFYPPPAGPGPAPPPPPPLPTPAGVVVRAGGGFSMVAGAASQTYTVTLNSTPANDVTVNIIADSEVIVDTTSLTFKSGQPPTTKTVTVSVPWSPGFAAPHIRTIYHTATATKGDPYDGINIASIPVSITSPEAGIAGGGAPAAVPAGEGGFVFGGGQSDGRKSSNPALAGPFLNPTGGFLVRNVAHRQDAQAKASAGPAGGGVGPLGWTLLTGAIAGASIIGWKVLRRPPG